MGANHRHCHPGLQRRAWLPLSGPQADTRPCPCGAGSAQTTSKTRNPTGWHRRTRLSYWKFHQQAPGPTSTDLEGHRHSSHWELPQRARDLPRLSQEGTDSSPTRGPASKAQSLLCWRKKAQRDPDTSSSTRGPRTHPADLKGRGQLPKRKFPQAGHRIHPCWAGGAQTPLPMRNSSGGGGYRINPSWPGGARSSH